MKKKKIDFEAEAQQIYSDYCNAHRDDKFNLIEAIKKFGEKCYEVALCRGEKKSG